MAYKGQPGFQRTYEELKQHEKVGSGVLYAGFQRTYEELKQKPSTGEENSWLGFQRTYEELKLIMMENSD